jgi:hypothetical protein
MGDIDRDRPDDSNEPRHEQGSVAERRVRCVTSVIKPALGAHAPSFRVHDLSRCADRRPLLSGSVIARDRVTLAIRSDGTDTLQYLQDSTL